MSLIRILSNNPCLWLYAPPQAVANFSKCLHAGVVFLVSSNGYPELSILLYKIDVKVEIPDSFWMKFRSVLSTSKISLFFFHLKLQFLGFSSTLSPSFFIFSKCRLKVSNILKTKGAISIPQQVIFSLAISFAVEPSILAAREVISPSVFLVMNCVPSSSSRHTCSRVINLSRSISLHSSLFLIS